MPIDVPYDILLHFTPIVFVLQKLMYFVFCPESRHGTGIVAEALSVCPDRIFRNAFYFKYPLHMIHERIYPNNHYTWQNNFPMVIVIAVVVVSWLRIQHIWLSIYWKM